MIKKKCESISQEVEGLAALPGASLSIKKRGDESKRIEKSTDTTSSRTSTTTVGKKRGYDKVTNKGANGTSGSDADKKRGKYMSFSHRLQLQREAEKQFAKFVRFLL